MTRVRAEIGLDLPLPVQFWRYLMKVLHGDFGISVITSHPVLRRPAAGFPGHAGAGDCWRLLIGVVLGVPMGVLAATHRGRWPDQVIRVVGLLGYSVPVFWLGLVGLLLFYAKLGWVGGTGPPRRGLRRHRAAGHRLDPHRQPARRRMGRVLERVLPPVLPASHPRLSLACLYRAHDAQLHARPAAAGIRHDGAGQGPVAVARRLACMRSATSWCR